MKKISNYYNLPSVSCNERDIMSKGNNNKTRGEICEQLNPENIYTYLFPSNTDPLSIYTKHQNKKINSIPKSELNTTDTTKCANQCQNINNCSFSISNNKCNIYNDINTDNLINDNDSTSFILDKSKTKNKLDNNYLTSYKDYSKKNFKGKDGDHKCEYKNNICEKIYEISCDKIKYNNDDDKTQIFNTQKYEPELLYNKKCNNKIFRINNVEFEKCQKNDKGFCINDLFTFDDLGFPISNDTPNPPDRNLLYTKDYDIKNTDKTQGWGAIYCPKNKNVLIDVFKKIKTKKDIDNKDLKDLFKLNGKKLCSSNNNYNDKKSMCIPYNIKLNNIEKSLIDPNDEIKNCKYIDNNIININNNNINCEKLCNTNKDCNIIEKSIQNDGKINCLYYKNDDNLIYYKNNLNKILMKRKNKYVYDPYIKKKRNLNKDEFSECINTNSGTSYIDYKTSNNCIENNCIESFKNKKNNNYLIKLIFSLILLFIIFFIIIKK